MVSVPDVLPLVAEPSRASFVAVADAVGRSIVCPWAVALSGSPTALLGHVWLMPSCVTVPPGPTPAAGRAAAEYEKPSPSKFATLVSVSGDTPVLSNAA